jgi:hypothetical protein
LEDPWSIVNKHDIERFGIIRFETFDDEAAQSRESMPSQERAQFQN